MPQLPFDRRLRRPARPALDAVATRLTEDQLIRQVLQGGGNMPAYGKNLSPPEVTALVSFLETLHPSSEPAAQDASQTQAAGLLAVPNLRRRVMTQTFSQLFTWDIPPVVTCSLPWPC